MIRKVRKARKGKEKSVGNGLSFFSGEFNGRKWRKKPANRCSHTEDTGVLRRLEGKREKEKNE